MMTIVRCFILLFVLCVNGVFAAERDPKGAQAQLRQLKFEYRLHMRAQSFANTLNVFDDLGLLGRGVSVDTRPLDSQESTSLPGADRLPGISFVPPSEAISTHIVVVQPEMGESGVHVDLRTEIETLEKALYEASRGKTIGIQKMKE